MHTFYNGLRDSVRTIIDASAGGALMKKSLQIKCGPYPIHGPARLASKMEGKCEKKMRVDFQVLENPSQRRNGFALESPLTFIFIFKWGKPSKNKKPQ